MRYLPAPLRGVISLFLYILSLLVSAILLLLTFLADKLLPLPAIQKITRFLYDYLPVLWIEMNRWIFKTFSLADIQLDLPPDLKPNAFYAVTCNHQSWTDILLLYHVFSRRIPMLKFFMKKQLKWVPIVGQVSWIYGFPFLHRQHTPTELKKHPEWKKRDVEIMRQACKRFKQHPGSLMIFAEGTRFTAEKHKKQNPSYHYLLKPKASGLALALQYMGDKINTLIDVTIIYPAAQYTFWDYCCGRQGKIIVTARSIPLSADLKGDYENDYDFRRHFQAFLNQLWSDKDEMFKRHES